MIRMQTSKISRGSESCDAKPLQYSFTNDELSGARFKARMAGACWLMTMAAH
jgi:hypothetical protein